MPFPNEGQDVGRARHFYKMTVDIDGVETILSMPETYERQTMTNGRPKLLIAVPPDRSGLFQALVDCLAGPLFLLYVLHTPRGEGSPGRYQSPPLDQVTLIDILKRFESYLAGDARHDIWVHSAEDRRTLVWDRHNLIHAEGEHLDKIADTLEALGFRSGELQSPGAGAHIHYYRPDFDPDAAALLACLKWTRSELRPEDEQ